MTKPIILITGANGQLGSEIQRIHAAYPSMQFVFADKLTLDITVESWVMNYLETHKPDAVINCAAYTNVERAEDEQDASSQANALAPGYLAKACKRTGALLIHISTDYVFDGTKTRAYLETDDVSPLNHYGQSKLEGERNIDNEYDRHYIIRTSWLYSSYGHNFFKTMIRLAKEKGELRVVNDQIASPTYAGDLACDLILLLKSCLIDEHPIPYGLYHYSQEGKASWCDFASAIVAQLRLNVPVYPVPSGAFPVKAIRPAFSKLNNSHWTKHTGFTARKWEAGLSSCIEELQRNES